MLLRLAVLAPLFALLIACTSATPVPAPAAEPVEEEAEAQEDIAERAIPEDALYPLLLAEFALRRKAYDVALDNYMEWAPRLRDKGVSAHTTHLSQYLQREATALEAVTLWVELEPDNAEANHTLGNLLIRKGDPVSALPHLATAQRAGTEVHFPALLSSLRALDDTQRKALLDGIDQLAKEFPDNTRLLLTQALGRAESKQYTVARNHLDTLFSLDPNNQQALILEAKILLEQEVDAPFERIERVLEQEDDQELRLQYARLLTRSDMDKARHQFEILSAKSPRDGDLLFSLALINREEGDHLAAAAYLRQVLALDQRVDEANYYLGRISEDKGDPAEALTHFMRVEEGNQYMPANSRIGKILLETGQTARSREWFEQQREQNPSRREQLFGLEADLLAAAGSYEPAMALLNAALENYPEATSLLYARAMLLEQRDDLAAVERDLRAILASDPTNTTALNALGYILANRTTRYEEALTLVSRALELQPSEPAILDSMGWVMFRLGRYKEAIGYLQRAYVDFPDPEVAAHLGEVLWTTGEKAKALTIWRAAALQDPDHAILSETLKRLGVDISLDQPNTQD